MVEMNDERKSWTDLRSRELELVVWAQEVDLLVFVVVTGVLRREVLVACCVALWITKKM
jgi:hypothetical protein